MAVKTSLSIKVIEDILSGYNLAALLAARPIHEGTVQTNYLLETTKARYVLRYYENRSVLSVQFEVNLLKHLTARRFPCPAPHKNSRGKYIGIYQDKPYVLYEFVEGEHLSDPNDEQKSQLIEQAARLHLITKDYRSNYSKYRLNYTVETCRQLAREISEKINTANSRAKLMWYNDELGSLELSKSLPKGICHCDFHFTNVLFKDGRFNALLDFDDANLTYLTFDLAYLLEPFKAPFEWDTWQQFDVNADVFDFASARKIVSEYTKHRKLNDNEKRHLFDVFKLSILVDCLWYFERGNVNDFFEKRKLDYLDRLGRDQFYTELFG